MTPPFPFFTVQPLTLMFSIVRLPILVNAPPDAPVFTASIRLRFFMVKLEL